MVGCHLDPPCQCHNVVIHNGTNAQEGAQTLSMSQLLRRKSKTEKPYVTDIHNSAASSSGSARAVHRNLLSFEHHLTCRVGLPACNGSSGTPAPSRRTPRTKPCNDGRKRYRRSDA
jgi:hypothetical protein